MSRLDEILKGLHWLPIQDRYDEPHPVYPGDEGLNDEHIKQAKADIKSLMLEIVGEDESRDLIIAFTGGIKDAKYDEPNAMKYMLVGKDQLRAELRKEIESL